MTVSEVAAITYAVLTGGVVIFQLALALGVPWGSYAMGGAFPGRFPPVMRAIAIGQAVSLGVLAAVVLTRSGLVLRSWEGTSQWSIWIVVPFCALSVVLNSISPSADRARSTRFGRLPLVMIWSVIIGRRSQYHSAQDEPGGRAARECCQLARA